MEDEIVESDAEEEEILKERDAVPLRIRIPGARVGPPAAAIPALIDPGMWLSMVYVIPPHLEVENMKKFILDYKRYSQNAHDNCGKCNNLSSRSSRLSVTKMAETMKKLWN